VARRFPKGKGMRVKALVRNEKGKAVMDFKGIPVEQLGLLAEALMAELPPVSGGPKPPPAPLAS
jgi:hypothetical protein